MDFGELDHQLSDRGWFVIENAIRPELYVPIRDHLVTAYEACRAVQIKNGISSQTYGTSHHIVGLAECYLNFLEHLPFKEYLTHFFEGPFILNSFGGVIVEKQHSSYANNVHRDIRTFSWPHHLMINTLIMLDDFTLENGATYLLSGSHRFPTKPDDDTFYAKAERATGSAGSLLVFDSNLWHAAGENKTEQPRRAVTPTYSKPFFKQQLDYARLIGYERKDTLSENLRQILGYYSRVPSSLEEWYQPPEKRFYLRDQG